jgi:hypothetical protein
MSFLNRLGFTMAAGASKMEYAMSALGWAGAAAGSRGMTMGARGHLAMSAGAGALYGGTFGRDPGQSRLEGAFTGALGGAGLYGAGRGAIRYGSAAMQGGRRTVAAYGRLAGTMMSGNKMSAGYSRNQIAQAYAMGAGRGALRKMQQDGRRAMQYIGNAGTKASEGFNKFRGLHR